MAHDLLLPLALANVCGPCSKYGRQKWAVEILCCVLVPSFILLVVAHSGYSIAWLGRSKLVLRAKLKSILLLMGYSVSCFRFFFPAGNSWQNLQCGESVTIEGQAYTISAVTHRYQLRKGKYEPSEKRLDVLSTGRYILNLYLDNLYEQSWHLFSSVHGLQFLEALLVIRYSECMYLVMSIYALRIRKESAFSIPSSVVYCRCMKSRKL